MRAEVKKILKPVPVENATYYGVYVTFRFYHLSLNCPLIREAKFKNINNIGYDSFYKLEDAINSGYDYPCPLCAIGVSKPIKIKIGENIYEFPLSGLDMITLFIIYNINKTGNYAKPMDLINIYGLKKEEIRPLIYYLHIFKLVKKILKNKRNFVFRVTELGMIVVSYIKHVLKLDIQNYSVKTLIEKYFPNFKFLYLYKGVKTNGIIKKIEEAKKTEEKFKQKLQEDNSNLSKLLKELGDFEI